MLELKQPEVILTHESDLDGLFSGMLLRKLAIHLFGVEPKLEAYHHDAWYQREMREKVAWICDLSLDPRVDRENWLVIDHHVTQHQPKRAHWIFDTQKSAGLQCYELLQSHGLGSPELDELSRYNNISDLFLDQEPDFEVSTDYASIVKTYHFWNVFKLLNGEPERLLNHPLLQVVQTKRQIEDPMGLEYTRNHIEPVTSDLGLVDIPVGNPNRILHLLLNEEDMPYKTLMTLKRKSTRLVIASLRSRCGLALEIAEKLGGGGHPNASGAALPKSVQSVEEGLDYIKNLLSPPKPLEMVADQGSGVEDLFENF